MFPRPLHITRQTDDSVSGRTSVVEQYCAGNRIVTISGGRVSIADYGSQEVTEIDHDRRTFSITKFEAIARALPPVRQHAATNMKVDVISDRSVTLSSDALEALIGAAYPLHRNAIHEAVIAEVGTGRRVAAATSAKNEFALPSEQTITIDEGAGAVAVIHQRVTYVGSEPAPPEAMAIDRDARRVESHLVETAYELNEADRLPNAKRR